MPNPAEDQRYMAAALRLGRRAMGRAAPNPAVGCVIVRPGADCSEIVGRGWTMSGGRPHAEAVALAEAGTRAKGATAYVTLEPCAHQGRAGPCTEALLRAGVARVVTAMTDPDPRTAGDGHERLRDGGVDVATGCLEEVARHDHLGHSLRVTEGRPFVQLKLAHSKDGYIAAAGRKQVRITGEAANSWVHRMRAQADAILVGAGTVRSDDPMLTCRLPGAEDRSPVRIVVDADLSIDPGCRLVKSAEKFPLWIVCRDDAGKDREQGLAALDVEVLRSTPAEDGRVDLAAALRLLAARGITRLMAEGGAEVARSLLEADLVDELVLIEGAGEIGPGGYPAFGTEGPDLADRCGALALAESFLVGDDRLKRYVRKT